MASSRICKMCSRNASGSCMPVVATRNASASGVSSSGRDSGASGFSSDMTEVGRRREAVSKEAAYYKAGRIPKARLMFPYVRYQI